MSRFLDGVQENSEFFLDILTRRNYYNYDIVISLYGDPHMYLKWEEFPEINNEADYNYYIQEWLDKTGFKVIDSYTYYIKKINFVERTFIFKYYDKFYQVSTVEYFYEESYFESNPIEVVPYKTTITKYKPIDSDEEIGYTSKYEIKGKDYELIFMSNKNKINKFQQILDIFKND
jgi:hypothetical protein